MINDNGFQKTEVGIIPNDWVVKTLGEIGEVKMCRRVFNYETQPQGKIPFYKIGTFGKEADAYISEELYNNYRQRFSFPKKGDILISAAGTIGRTIIYNGEPSYFQDSNIVWIDNNENLVSNNFLNHVFQVVKYNTEGGTIQRLYNNILKSTKFFCPPTKEEQTAIANALNDADELITRLEKLIAKKRNIKQGAMQELLKPKDDWEVKKLGECLSQNPDYGINAPAVLYDELLPVYLRITDITEDGKYSKKNIVSVNSVYSSQYFLEKGDLVFARTGASVGKTYLYNPNDGRLVFAGFLIRVKVNPKVLVPEYFQFFTQTSLYWDWIRSNSMRTGQPGINGNEYKELPINLPSNVEEQTRIAQILSDMDAEIEALEKKLEKYKMLKQGMMQNLLTGKIRLIDNK